MITIEDLNRLTSLFNDVDHQNSKLDQECIKNKVGIRSTSIATLYGDFLVKNYEPYFDITLKIMQDPDLKKNLLNYLVAKENEEVVVLAIKKIEAENVDTPTEQANKLISIFKNKKNYPGCANFLAALKKTTFEKVATSDDTLSNLITNIMENNQKTILDSMAKDFICVYGSYITLEERQSIEAKNTPKERSKELIDIILKKNSPAAYNMCLAAIEKTKQKICDDNSSAANVTAATASERNEVVSNVKLGW